MSKKTIIFIISLFIIWRIITSITAYINIRYFAFKPTFPYVDTALKYSKNILIWPWANFDGEHYLHIAEKEYGGYEQAFFPLYPLLIRFLSPIFFDNRLLCGLFISHVCFLISLFILYKLVGLDYEDKIAKWVIIFLVVFPTSFFFGSLYTESLFLMLILLSFYGARTNKWWLAGLSGMLASATRLVGIFLLPALLIEYYQQLKIKINKSDSFKIKSLKIDCKLKIVNCKFLYLFLIPLGLLSYMFYLWKSTGDPLMFFHVQELWQRKGIILLPQVFWRYLKIFLTVNPLSIGFFIALIEFIITFMFIIILIRGAKKIRLSYSIFSWMVFIVPTLTGTLLSMPRFVLTIFPAFIIMAIISRKLTKILLLTTFIVLNIILLSLFIRGFFVS